MLRIERIEKIIDKLQKEGIVQIKNLAEEFGVSQMTIRRDLDILEKRGLAYKTHGGALLQKSQFKEIPFTSKQKHNHEEKKKIAKKAIDFVYKEATIFLDAGTTTYELAKLLASYENLNVITTDLNIANYLCKTRNNVYIVGGLIQKETSSVIGAMGFEFVSSLHFDISFIGTSGVNREWMLVTPTPEKGILKKKIIENSHKAILLADHSKFFVNSLYSICSLEEFCAVITGKTFEENEQEELESLGVLIIKI
ncbi:MAG: DeoR/GlpR transcriptional regulator [Thermosipho sp. (in: Bacteria)]|nr:DeoR/GlpR transcriptional regulator [Thermosipho sp. (in: thermotogales)]